MCAEGEGGRGLWCCSWESESLGVLSARSVPGGRGVCVDTCGAQAAGQQAAAQPHNGQQHKKQQRSRARQLSPNLALCVWGGGVDYAQVQLQSGCYLKKA
jgi:hypothetical protein